MSAFLYEHYCRGNLLNKRELYTQNNKFVNVKQKVRQVNDNFPNFKLFRIQLILFSYKF